MTDQLSPSAQIDRKLADLADWRGEALAHVRALIHEADPGVVEAVKWAKPTNPSGVPTWEHAGIICTGEICKDKVKLTFAHGAALPDPERLFNAGFGGGTRRAIDLQKGETVEATAFAALIRAAIAYNLARKKRAQALSSN